jgi:hypothetical protein
MAGPPGPRALPTRQRGTWTRSQPPQLDRQLSPKVDLLGLPKWADLRPRSSSSGSGSFDRTGMPDARARPSRAAVVKGQSARAAPRGRRLASLYVSRRSLESKLHLSTRRPRFGDQRSPGRGLNPRPLPYQESEFKRQPSDFRGILKRRPLICSRRGRPGRA